MSFVVGQKVVCVDNSPYGDCDPFDPGECPIVGEVYTVWRYFADEYDGEYVVWLKEISRCEEARRYWNDDNIGYGAFRFRPVQTRSTDISVFKEMLRDTKVDA